MTLTRDRRPETPIARERLPADESTLRSLPPSAKLVLKVLQVEGTLTQKQLATETLLPQRTVREAVSNLTDLDVVEERPHIMDARQSTYRLNVEIA